MIEGEGKGTFSVWLVDPQYGGGFHKSRSTVGSNVTYEFAINRARHLKEYLSVRTGYSVGPARVFIVPDTVESIDLDKYFRDNK